MMLTIILYTILLYNMNILLLPEDTLNIICKLLSPNINNLLKSCKLFNKIINNNISRIYKEQTYEYCKYNYFHKVALNMYSYLIGQKPVNEKMLKIAISQYKIYDNKKCEIICNAEYNHIKFLKNVYDESTLDYIHFYNNSFKFYIIIPVLNGISSLAFCYDVNDLNVVQTVKCIYPFENNKINNMSCNDLFVKLTNINASGGAILLRINTNIYNIMYNILSNIDNYNNLLEIHSNLLYAIV